ncbi:MAG: transcriptional repressor LexA [Clostridiales bacterium]|nr:transcriptional repressor LexA [Clostridiales bacterium]
MPGRRPHGETQQRILEYIRDYQKVNGYPPSVREIGKAVGLKSTSTVQGHLDRLQKKGMLHRDASRPRTLDLTDAPRNTSQRLPVVGKIAAGSPILAEESIEDYLFVPDSMLGEGEHFILSVRGESMIGCGIMDGDYVIIHRQSEVNNGDIAVAMIDGDATLKRFYRENEHVRLQPENPAMEPIIVKPGQVDVLGKACAVYRKLG